MKREIICLRCAARLSKSMKEYPGEGHKFVKGESKVMCVCDHCVVNINPGDSCSALSIWTDHNPYYEWEHEYLEASK